MAGLITVRLQRNDAQPWGFRLQGGKDFGTPLLIQKVNGGSLAEKAGLQVADAVIKVNGQDVYNLRHKDAQDSIVKAGNSMEVVVSRSPGGTWKPNVTPVGNIPAPSPVGGAPASVTKTSLAYKGPPAPTIPGYNTPAKPFSPQFNGVGADPASVKSITSKQYNNPVGLYSDQTIAETLSAQAEVLAGGVLGVNFMKNEKTKFDASHSEVLKLVQEIDSEPKTPEPVEPVSPGGVLVAPPPVSMPGVKHVTAPENKPPSTTNPQTPLQPGQNVCADCERLIIGVFVRIKDKNLHVDCFKCATCGTSLKNVGYYNINNKLYCDIHAKLVARANPPASNLDPITIPPGGPIPSGVLPAPLAPAGPTSPQPGTLAPLPFHAPRLKPSHVSAPRSFKPPPSNAAPQKPFGAPATPPKFSAPAAPPQFSAPAAPPQFSAPAAPPQFSAPASSVKAPTGKPFSSVQFNPPSAPAPAPFSAPAPAPFSSAPAPPSSFPKTLPGQIPSKPLGKQGQSELSHSTSQSYTETTKGQVGEIEDISCCMDKSKRMSVCSSEVCNLSEKRSAVKVMAPLMEDPVRASPVPFSKGEVVSESFGAVGQETLKKSENLETSEEGNVHRTRKTKVEESFVRSQNMYSAEISSSQSAVQMRAASPELEQIMMRKQVYQSYDTAGLTPQQKQPQSERCLTPEIENLMEKPHGSWSPMPPACMVRPISPHAIISYPPDMPSIHHSIPQPRVATPEQFQEARETVERFVDHSKHVKQSQAVTQSYLQQSFTQQQQQQYTPRYDMSESFSAYNVRGSAGNGYSNGTTSNAGNQNGHNVGNPHNPGTNVNTGNPHNSGNSGNPGNHGNGNPSNHGKGNPGNHGNGNPGNHGNGNPGNHGNGNPGNHGNGNPGNHGNGNPGNHGNGNPGNHGNGNPGKNNSGNHGQFAGNGNPGDKGDEENPTVTEPDDSEEKYSRKSSGQSQKSKKSASEEESSRRVFTDFGGPQVMTSLNVESTTEGGVEKTSVTKSEKMEYSSCEFESTRKSTILQNNKGNEEGKASSGESRKQSYPKFTATEASVDEEESVTKSQVEQIIKQELNKVFQMAQAMDKTNLNEMYDQRSQQSSQTAAQVSAVKATEKSSQKVDQTVSSSQYSEKKSFSGEVITKTGKLTSGLTIAPDRSFTPQPLESNFPLTYQNIPSDFPPPRFPPGEPKPETKPGYIPVTGSRDSPLLNALTIAPDRPYSPLPTATVVETPPFITAPKPQGSSMLEALTTAPSAPFTFGESNLVVEESSTVQRTTKSKQESVQKYAPKPSQDDFKPISTFEPDSYSKYASLGQSVERSTVKSYQPVTDELKSAFSSTSKVQSQRNESEIQQSVKSHQTSLSSSRIERSLTPSGLHPPDLLPYYQRNIGEIPLAHRSNSPVPHQIKAPELKPPRPDSVPHPTTERRGSVKALSEAYNQQIEALNNKYQPTPTDTSCSSVSYISAGAYSSGSVTKTYSYEQDHKSIDAMGYHPSPLAGKRTPLAGERTIPKCSSPVLGKLDHTKQVFKPSVPAQQPTTFQSPIAEQASLRQAPPFFTQEKEKPQTPWVVVKEEKENVSAASFRLPPPPKPTSKPSLPTFPLVNKASALPEPPKPPSVLPDAGPGGAKGASTAGTTAPRRGRGVLNAAVGAGARVPLCGSCNNQIRGPFITALGKIWCPDHFVCVNAQCRRPLQDIGFVEEEKGLYCEYCFEQYLAPSCNKCNAKIKGDCLNAIGKHFHPECFTCAYCGKLFGNSPFFLEDALPYCEADWNELFTTKCFSCGFPIEAGDRWVEALNNNYHSQCFSCTMCKKNLEGQSFFAKGGRPFCKNHAR